MALTGFRAGRVFRLISARNFLAQTAICTPCLALLSGSFPLLFSDRSLICCRLGGMFPSKPRRRAGYSTSCLLRARSLQCVLPDRLLRCAHFPQWPRLSPTRWTLQKCQFRFVLLKPPSRALKCSQLQSRMQTIETAPGAKKPSLFHVLRTSVQESGLRSVYTGLSAAWLRQMSYSLVRLGTYEEFKSRLSRNGPPSSLALIAAASFAGGLGGIVGNPAGASRRDHTPQFAHETFQTSCWYE